MMSRRHLKPLQPFFGQRLLFHHPFDRKPPPRISSCCHFRTWQSPPNSWAHSCRTQRFYDLSRRAERIRLISTDTKQGIKSTGKGIVKWTVVFWIVIGCWASIQFGVESVTRERSHPTPPEWTEWSRIYLRMAAAEEDSEGNENGVVDWARAGANYCKVIQRLEDPKVDGAGLESQLGGGEDIYVLGVGKTGFDISAKSEPWRRGYHQALMGAAHAAEHLDTWVRDKTRKAVFPPQVVVGPSNLDPRPVPFGAMAPPQEEDCEPAFETPHHYYLKILTTRGFTSRQRLDAALSYADWLCFKGLVASADDVYAWALDIAEAGMSPKPSPIGKRTGILKPGTTGVSTNVLLALTSLAMHRAQTGDFAAALPVFLSVLRAQQSLPLPSQITRPSPRASDENSVGRTVMSFLKPSYPSAPPTGDEPATRTPANLCAEAGTMLHIGEILFASTPLPSPSTPGPSSSSLASWLWPWASSTAPSSPDPLPSHIKGLAWTRDAVDLATATLLEIQRDLPALTMPAPAGAGLLPGSTLGSSASSASTQSVLRPEERNAQARCAECLVAGMRNWVTMVDRLAAWEAEGKTARLRADGKSEAEARVSRLLFEREGEEGVQGPWQAEVGRVAERSRETRRMLKESRLEQYV